MSPYAQDPAKFCSPHTSFDQGRFIVDLVFLLLLRLHSAFDHGLRLWSEGVESNHEGLFIGRLRWR